MIKRRILQLSSSKHSIKKDMLFSLGQIEIILVRQGGSTPSPPLPHLGYASAHLNLIIIFIKLSVNMDIFQNLLLRKRKTQEDEMSDTLFKRRKTSNYHMEQVITAVACTASGLLQTNTRKPRSADKPRDSGWWENGS